MKFLFSEECKENLFCLNFAFCITFCINLIDEFCLTTGKTATSYVQYFCCKNKFIYIHASALQLLERENYFKINFFLSEFCLDILIIKMNNVTSSVDTVNELVMLPRFSLDTYSGPYQTPTMKNFLGK